MLRNLLHIPRKAGVKLQHGFTMVELIAVMVIAGILAAVAVPKYISDSPFQARGFADQVESSLRYAQKIAIAQHHNVCVTPTSSGITLMISSVSTSACPGNINLVAPTNDSSLIYAQTPCTSSSPTYGICSPSTSLILSATTFYFDPLGKPFDPTGAPSNKMIFTISGATNPVVVEGETGYVHSP